MEIELKGTSKNYSGPQPLSLLRKRRVHGVFRGSLNRVGLNDNCQIEKQRARMSVLFQLIAITTFGKFPTFQKLGADQIIFTRGC
jgi:hypothetical protein